MVVGPVGWMGKRYFDKGQIRQLLSEWNLPEDLYEFQDQLETIEISNIPITNLRWLQSVRLRSLLVTRAPIKTVEGAENLTALTSLNVSSNQLQDLSGVEKLEKLEFLDLHDTNVSDLSPLKSLIHLRRVVISSGKIRTLKGLPPSVKELAIDNIDK